MKQHKRRRSGNRFWEESNRILTCGINRKMNSQRGTVSFSSGFPRQLYRLASVWQHHMSVSSYSLLFFTSSWPIFYPFFEGDTQIVDFRQKHFSHNLYILSPMLRDLDKSKTNQKESGDPQSSPTAHNFVCFDLIPTAKRHGHSKSHVL